MAKKVHLLDTESGKLLCGRDCEGAEVGLADCGNCLRLVESDHIEMLDVAATASVSVSDEFNFDEDGAVMLLLVEHEAILLAEMRSRSNLLAAVEELGSRLSDELYVRDRFGYVYRLYRAERGLMGVDLYRPNHELVSTHRFRKVERLQHYIRAGIEASVSIRQAWLDAHYDHLDDLIAEDMFWEAIQTTAPRVA